MPGSRKLPIDTTLMRLQPAVIRGYYQAHLKPYESVRTVFTGANAGEVLRQGLQSWDRAIWGPSLRVGIFQPTDLAG